MEEVEAELEGNEIESGQTEARTAETDGVESDVNGRKELGIAYSREEG